MVDRARAVTCGSLVAAAAVFGGDLSAETVLARAISLEELVGRARVRSVFATRVDVPVRCEDGALGCFETVPFEQVVEVELALESRATRDGDVVVAEEAVGRLFVGSSLDDDDVHRFRTTLDRRLRSLAAEAYRNPLAGLDASQPPFDSRTLARVDFDAWVCEDRANERRAWRHRRTGSDGDGRVDVSVGSTGHTDPDIADPLCDGLSEAVSGAWPDEVRTLTVPTVLMVEEVRVEQDVLSLVDTAWRDELVALPPGTSRARRTSPGARSGSSYAVDDSSGEVRASYTRDQVQTATAIRPAHFPARTLDAPSWSQRWTVERVERRLGAFPSDVLVDRFELVVGWLPVPPAIEQAADGSRSDPGDGPFEIVADPRALVRNVGQRLEDAGRLTPGTLLDAVTLQPDGLDSDGWMYIVCLPDGRAEWGVPPTNARTAVIDPLPVCGAIDADIASATDE